MVIKDSHQDTLLENNSPLIITSENLISYPEGLNFLRKQCNENTNIHIIKQKNNNNELIDIGLILTNITRNKPIRTCILKIYDSDWLNKDKFKSFIEGFYKNRKLMILSNEFKGWGTRKVNTLTQELDIVLPNKFNNFKLNTETKIYIIENSTNSIIKEKKKFLIKKTDVQEIKDYKSMGSINRTIAQRRVGVMEGLTRAVKIIELERNTNMFKNIGEIFKKKNWKCTEKVLTYYNNFISIIKNEILINFTKSKNSGQILEHIGHCVTKYHELLNDLQNKNSLLT